MSENVTITKVVFDVNGKKLEMTVEEAKELLKILEFTFKKEDKIVYREYVPYTVPCFPTWPYHYWNGPTYTLGTVTFSMSTGTSTVEVQNV
jgi:hypothetical protein